MTPTPSGVVDKPSDELTPSGASPIESAIDPDARLMLRVRDDDAFAFEELVRRYQNRLLTVLEHSGNGRDQAEDLVQETFLRVFRARKTYRADAKFSTWVFTIAHNVAKNAIRRRSRRKEVSAERDSSTDSAPGGIEGLAQANSGWMPARRLDKSEAGQMVRLALDSLSERQRVALLLTKFENMSYQDVADTMGLSVQAVKSLLFRARLNLKAMLEPYVEQGRRPHAAPPDDAD
jgi:RNA polymerase sigma-70 factor (ECF subfamily)